MLYCNSFKKILLSILLAGVSLLSTSSFAVGSIPESARTALYVNTYYFQSDDRFKNTESVLEYISLEKNKETVCIDVSLADKCYVQGVRKVVGTLPLIPLVIHWYYNEEDGRFITSMDQYGNLISVEKNWFHSDDETIVTLVGSRYAIPLMW